MNARDNSPNEELENAVGNMDACLFGDSALYARLCLITGVLGSFVSFAPRPVNAAELERQTGCPPGELAELCALLADAGLIRPHPGQQQHWLLARETSSITLEDAFRCALNKQAARGAADRPDVTPAPVRREVDMLVMQATMGINQSVLQHLRRFSLDRLKMTAAGMFPSKPGSLQELPPGWSARGFSFS
jgi:DNA-binding IscR family transcriptional regulator